MTADPSLAAVPPVPLRLDRTWTYGQDVQHGGRLLELLARAAVDAVPHPHPMAVTAHFLSRPRLGAATVEREVLRTGRSVSTVSARLVQDGRVSLDAVVTAGRLGEPGPPVAAVGGPPDLPPVEQCVRDQAPPGTPRVGMTEQLDMRVDRRVPPGGPQPEVRAWLRYADDREVDAAALLCLADALPPVTFSLGHHGWAPTVSLTVLVRSLPAPGWLRTVQRARLVADGWLDETCEIWDSTDRLVAQAVQLAGFRPA